MCRSPITMFLTGDEDAGSATPPAAFCAMHAMAVSKLTDANPATRCAALRGLDVARCAEEQEVIPQVLALVADEADAAVRLAAAAVLRLLPTASRGALVEAAGGVAGLAAILSRGAEARSCAVNCLQQLCEAGGPEAAEAEAALAAAGMSPAVLGQTYGLGSELRSVVAQASPLMEAADYERANGIYRAAAARHAPFCPTLQAALDAASAHATNSRWVAYNVYRRAFDQLIIQSVSDATAECFLYFWDGRDGDAWMGWWITPEDVGCMRFWAFCRWAAGDPNVGSRGAGSERGEPRGGIRTRDANPFGRFQYPVGIQRQMGYELGYWIWGSLGSQPCGISALRDLSSAGSQLCPTTLPGSSTVPARTSCHV